MLIRMTRTIRNRIAQFVGVVLALFAGSAVAAAVAQTESAKPEVVLLVAGKAAENPHVLARAKAATDRTGAQLRVAHTTADQLGVTHLFAARGYDDDRHRRSRPPDRRRPRRRPLPRRSVRRHGFEPARPRIVALAEPGLPVRLPTLETMNKYVGNKWVTLVLVCLAQFMVILDATIVNIALPAIQTDLDFSDANLQWVVNGYTLLFGGFLLLGGRAADIFGRKRVFIAGVILFSVASLLNGLATNAGQLVAFRGLQGLGGALVSPAALSIITTTFAEGSERTKALGVWGAIAAGGGAFGLLLGGVLVETLSWEWVFFVNVPIGIAAALLSARLIVESKAERAGAFDILGAVLVTSGLMVLVYAIVRAEHNGWGSAATLGLGAVALALLVAFIAVEARIRGPLVRLDIFKVRTLAVANLVLLLVAAGLFAMFFFASLYVQRILGFSPIEAGLAFLPVTAGILVGSVTAQAGVKRFGAGRTRSSAW